MKKVILGLIIQNYSNVNIKWINSEEVTVKTVDKLLKDSQAHLKIILNQYMKFQSKRRVCA